MILLSVVADSATGSGDLILYGIPLGTIASGWIYVVKTLRSDVAAKDVVIATKDAEIARLNTEATERAERLTPLVIEVTKLVPDLLARTPTPVQMDQLTDALNKIKPQARRAG